MRRATRGRHRAGFRTLRSSAAIIAAALALGACSPSGPQPAGHSGSSASPRPAPATTSRPSSAHGGSAAAGSSGPLGSALTVTDSSGTELAVTVEKVIDPASGASKYSKPAAGKHFVGVQLRVANKAAKPYQNNANNETTIVLSDDKKKDADFNPIAGCGNFDNGQIKLASGAASTGCVTFQVPNGQQVARVRYGNTVFPGTSAQWHAG